MKKYSNPYKAEKQQYEEALQRYQDNHMDEVEIINMHKMCNKAGAKTFAKAGTKSDVKAGAKAPSSGYPLNTFF